MKTTVTFLTLIFLLGLTSISATSGLTSCSDHATCSDIQPFCISGTCSACHSLRHPFDDSLCDTLLAGSRCTSSGSCLTASSDNSRILDGDDEEDEEAEMTGVDDLVNSDHVIDLTTQVAFQEIWSLDFNGDGNLDLVAVSQNINGSNGGCVLVLGDGMGFDDVDFTVIDNETSFLFVGEIDAVGEVSAVADFNGDGMGDIVIGSGNAGGGNGVIWVIWGVSDPASVFDSSEQEIDVLGTLITMGSSGVGFPQRAVLNVGDIDGDNSDDLIFAHSGFIAILGGGSAGSSFVTVEIDGDGNNVNSSDDVYIFKVPTDVENIGNFPTWGLGLDFNGDGINDLLIGDGSSPASQDGYIYILFGVDGGWESIPTELGGYDFYVMGGDSVGIGRKTASAGDINGDGMDDFVILPSSDSASLPTAGFVIYGNTDISSMTPWDPTGDMADYMVTLNVESTNAGDLYTSAILFDWTGDGIKDLWIGIQEDSSDDLRMLMFDLAAIGDSTTIVPENCSIDGSSDQSFASDAWVLGDLNGDGLEDIAFRVDNDDDTIAHILYGGWEYNDECELVSDEMDEEEEMEEDEEEDSEEEDSDEEEEEEDSDDETEEDEESTEEEEEEEDSNDNQSSSSNVSPIVSSMTFCAAMLTIVG